MIDGPIHIERGDKIYHRYFEDSISLALLRILKKNNVKIITSSDAHCPEDVGYKIMELK